jgi:hypothetical protein
MLYNMIINTDKMAYVQAARLIGAAVINRVKQTPNPSLMAR